MRRRFLLLPLLAALVLAGCGGGDDEAATATQGNGESALLADAAAATTQAKSSRVSLVASVGGRRLTGQGAYDFRAERGTLGVDLGALDEGLGEADLVVSDRVLYYHLPAGLALVAGGKNWVKVDLQTLGEATGTNLGALAQGNLADPGRYLEWLKASGEDVEEVGSESVRGVETEHYRATIDLDKVAEIAPPEARELVELVDPSAPRHIVETLLLRAQLPQAGPEDESAAVLEAIPVGGAALQDVVAKVLATPKQIVARARHLLE